MVECSAITFENFISRCENFHINSEAFRNVIQDYPTLFEGLYNLNNSLFLELDNMHNLNRDELLEAIFTVVYDYLIMHMEMSEIFGKCAYTELCPDVLNDYAEEIEEFLKEDNSNMESADEIINIPFYRIVRDACLFNTLHNYLYCSKDGKSLSLKEFVRKHSSRNYPDDIYKYELAYDDESKCDLYEEFFKEVNKLGVWKHRVSKMSKGLHKRSDNSAIPECIEHEMTLYYNLSHPADPSDPIVIAYDKVSKIFNTFRINHALPKDNEYERKMEEANRSVLSRIKKNADYENYLELGKYILCKLKENPKYYGFALYRFEMQHRLYAITNEVNSIVDVDHDMERTIALVRSYSMEDIHFPNVRAYFGEIEDNEIFDFCISQFKSLMTIARISTMLVINGFIQNGYLGDDWYDFFLDTLNEMAEDVLYSPKDIDYSCSHEAKELFKKILSFPITTRKGMSVINRQLEKDIERYEWSVRNGVFPKIKNSEWNP